MQKIVHLAGQNSTFQMNRELDLPVGGTPTSLKDAVVVARVAQAVSDAEFKIKGHHTNSI